MKQLAIYGLFIISTALLLLDSLTPFYINTRIIYFIILFIALISLTIIIGDFWLKLGGDRLKLFSALTIGVLFIVAYLFLWLLRLDWKTQTIMFKNLHLENKTIEFQMQDFGAFGSNQRTVERFKILPYFDWIKEISQEKIDTLTWQKVNIEVDTKLGL